MLQNRLTCQAQKYICQGSLALQQCNQLAYFLRSGLNEQLSHFTCFERFLEITQYQLGGHNLANGEFKQLFLLRIMK